MLRSVRHAVSLGSERTDHHTSDPQTGEILSDEAAHHDPALNNDSFKLRGR